MQITTPMIGIHHLTAVAEGSWVVTVPLPEDPSTATPVELGSAGGGGGGGGVLG